MGSEQQPKIPNLNNTQNNNFPYSSTNNYSSNNNANIIQNNQEIIKDNTKLNPIRRHSNIYTSKNSAEYITPLHSSLTLQKKSSQEINPVFERNKNRKLSQQYCENFKKSYSEHDTTSFLNRLADSLNHGKQIPYEEIEQFKKAYLPKYLIDWRIIDEQKQGLAGKSWKNFGKIPQYQVENILDKMGNTMISKEEPFYLKRCWFYRYLMRNYARNKEENPIVILNRNNILEDSYNVLTKQKINLARPLNIRFANEIIDDERGIYRDWYQCMFKDIISPNKKLFLINPYKTIEPYNIIIYPKYPGMKFELYEFLGKFIIKSIVDMIIIRNFIINKLQLKLITKQQITLEDMKYYNIDLYQKLQYINNTQIFGNKQLDTIKFTWNIPNNNTLQEIELIPGGRNIFLNDQNKNIFISKVIYVEAIMPFEEQIKYIQKGLFSILGEGVQGVFTVEEMNFFITGQEDIDLKDLRENIIYKGEYNDNHPVIKLFWEKIYSLNKNDLIKFLQFATGSSAVPIDGFGALKDVHGRIQKLTIEPFMNYAGDNPDVYTFHKIESKKTYNTIMLPKYRTKNELDNAINMIIMSQN